MSTPNLAGFADAQSRLRDAIGIDAVFVHDGAKTYDPSVQLNPQTGEPYDPFATPTSSTAETRETIRCSVVTKALAGRTEHGQVTDTAIGWMSDAGMALIMDIADADRAEGADTVEAEGEEWELRQLRRDELGSRAIAFVGHR